jgi:hypothetical protein
MGRCGLHPYPSDRNQWWALVGTFGSTIGAEVLEQLRVPRNVVEVMSPPDGKKVPETAFSSHRQFHLLAFLSELQFQSDKALWLP